MPAKGFDEVNNNVLEVPTTDEMNSKISQAKSEVSSQISSTANSVANSVVQNYTYSKTSIDDKLDNLENKIPSSSGITLDSYLGTFTGGTSGTALVSQTNVSTYNGRVVSNASIQYKHSNVNVSGSLRQILNALGTSAHTHSVSSSCPCNNVCTCNCDDNNNSS